jgi:two-component system LytT family sensor kinase
MKTTFHQYLRFFSKYRLHFLAWFVFICYEILINRILVGTQFTFGNYAVFYSCNIFLFYFHAHVALPAVDVKSKKALWLFPIIFIAEIAVYIPFVLGTARFFMEYFGVVMVNPPSFTLKTVLSVIWRCVYFLLFSTGYYFIIRYIREHRTLQQAEKERLMMIIENQNVQTELVKSQHAHLKAQINPHFLFNTLSFIYSSARKTAPEAAEAIMSLSQMMRYAIQDNERTYTALGLEIEQTENLINLHRIRSGHTIYIVFDYEAGLEEVPIIPLILITLVENIFKHGNLQQEQKPAIVRISKEQGILSIETSNLIGMTSKHSSHHIGLENIAKRLAIVYNEQASIQTAQKEGCFEVRVSIQLS